MPEPRDSAVGQPRPDPNEKLVKVFDSEDESEALVVKENCNSGARLRGAARRGGVRAVEGALALVRPAKKDANGTWRVTKDFRLP